MSRLPAIARLRLVVVVFAAMLAATTARAQFITYDGAEAAGRNLTVVRSPADANVTVSYRQPEGVCNTAFGSQQQYTGWVSVPSGDYPTNLFFWYVEARQPTDRLTLWINGGPGASSMYGFFTGNGPCAVVERGFDAFDTVARDWGWDRASNMLFIDQPNQVGFSYDTPHNGTARFVSGTFVEPPQQGPADPSRAWQALNGTFSSLNGNYTANTTQTAAVAVWHLVQGFLATFPRFKASPNVSVGINLFAESYGGRYGPIFAETFERQNARRAKGLLPRNATVDIRLVSLGIVNGCVDRAIQVPFYPRFASQNTYGFQAIGITMARLYEAKFAAPGGCQDLLDQCQTAVNASRPRNMGSNETVDALCSRAVSSCDEIAQPYYSSGRSPYDLAAPFHDPFPSNNFLEYLNQGPVLGAVGSPVNFTVSSTAVMDDFLETGDMARGGDVRRLAALLQSGVRVGLIYGDRDYICNWLGGEAVSQAVASQAGAPYASAFPAAGYAPIIVNSSYIGGVVRQFGNLSFSRVYQSGHSVASYQPETAFQIFARIILGNSVSTGDPEDLSSFGSSGPANATHSETLPLMPTPTCWVRAFSSTCPEASSQLADSGGGTVINGVLYASSTDWPLAASSTPPTSTPPATSTLPLTGIYTATQTPDSGAGRVTMPRMSCASLVSLVLCSVLSCRRGWS